MIENYKPMQKHFPLDKIKPNPFRHMDRYPIQRDKVEALKASLRRTGFWENIVAREVNREAEIAFGHHRLVALQEELGPKAKVPLIIKDLDDEAMLQMMARENMEDWSTSATVEQETVRAVVAAYSAGRIALPAVPKDAKKTIIRYAPSFVSGTGAGDGENRPYTSTLVAEFLGWPEHKVHSTLSALELVEQQVVKEEHFQGLSTKQAEALTAEAKKTKRAYEGKAREQPSEEAKKKAEEKGKKEAAKVADHVAEKHKTGEIGYKEAAKEATKVRGKVPGTAAPDANSLAAEVIEYLDGILGQGDPNTKQLKQLIGQVKRLNAESRRSLRVALDKLSDRCIRFYEELQT